MTTCTMVISNLSNECKNMILNMIHSIMPDVSFDMDGISNNNITVYTSGNDKLIISNISDTAILMASSPDYAFALIKALSRKDFIERYIMSILNCGSESKNIISFTVESDSDDIIDSMSRLCTIATVYKVSANMNYSKKTEQFGSRLFGYTEYKDKDTYNKESFVVVNMYKDGEVKY